LQALYWIHCGDDFARKDHLTAGFGDAIAELVVVGEQVRDGFEAADALNPGLRGDDGSPSAK